MSKCFVLHLSDVVSYKPNLARQYSQADRNYSNAIRNVENIFPTT